HYGHSNGSSEIDFITVNFEGSPLWLIHGPNGSGKSALFDAITFALFREYRGGGTNFERLIHHGADEAEVRLEIELDGERYRIDRMITRLRRGARVSGIVHHWDGVD